MLTNSLLNQRLLDNLNTGVVLLDADLNVVFMNPAAESQLEISGKRGIGVPYTGNSKKQATLPAHTLSAHRDAFWRLPRRCRINGGPLRTIIVHYWGAEGDFCVLI